jgi:hypothetical protein
LYLIPLHRQDFGPADAGLALETLGDGTCRADVNARGVAAEEAAGRQDECTSKNSAQDIRPVIEKGQVRVETLRVK